MSLLYPERIKPTEENLIDFMNEWTINRRGDAIACLLAALGRFTYPNAVDVERKGDGRPVGVDHDLWIELGRP